MPEFRGPLESWKWVVAAVIATATISMPLAIAGQSGALVAPGRMVDVGGHRLFIDCRGAGAPTVVIEAGTGSSSLAWLHVQQALSPTTRSCVYDRAGLGRSEPGPGATDGRSMARELHALLAATESGPYILAGHSFGGYIARLYRDLYPNEVVGLALVESAHEAQWSRLPAAVRQLLDLSVAGMRARVDSARAGTLDEADVGRDTFFGRAEDVWREYRRQSVDPDHLKAQVDELAIIDRVAEEVTATGPLGDLPLAVLSSAREFDPYRGTPIPVDEANAIWLELQTELGRLSSNVVHVVSMTGLHTIQYEEPGIVLGVLIELLERVRAK